MKVFAISHTSGSLIHPLCVSGLATNGERTVLERLCFTEQLEMVRYEPYLPCIESIIRGRPEWTPPPSLTLLALQVVLSSLGPHLSSRALLHKAHHPGWYGPHLASGALLHSLPSHPALPHPPNISWVLETSTAASYRNVMSGRHLKPL